MSSGSSGHARAEVFIIEHGHPDVAASIHAISQAAYEVERDLLGVTRFAPLDATIDEVRESSAAYLGAHQQGELIGVLAYELQGAAGRCEISSLVVNPARHRQGVASLLLQHLIAGFGQLDLAVSTGAKNEPAIALYLHFGFVEQGREFKDDGNIEIVHLTRAHHGRAEPV